MSSEGATDEPELVIDPDTEAESKDIDCPSGLQDSEDEEDAPHYPDEKFSARPLCRGCVGVGRKV